MPPSPGGSALTASGGGAGIFRAQRKTTVENEVVGTNNIPCTNLMHQANMYDQLSGQKIKKTENFKWSPGASILGLQPASRHNKRQHVQGPATPQNLATVHIFY
jgi:hypothetical protein